VNVSNCNVTTTYDRLFQRYNLLRTKPKFKSTSLP
jgi:hypothetical protein